MLYNVHQNGEQPRVAVCAWREPVEDLPGTKACFLDHIVGRAGIFQQLAGLAVQGSQIGQGDRFKVSDPIPTVIRFQRSGAHVRLQGLRFCCVTDCAHVKFIRSRSHYGYAPRAELAEISVALPPRRLQRSIE
jgi:hypothetical protein